MCLAAREGEGLPALETAATTASSLKPVKAAVSSYSSSIACAKAKKGEREKGASFL